MLTESSRGSTSSRILNKLPRNGMDGGLTKTQVTSRSETIWPDVWSSMSKCAQQKAQQQRNIDKNMLQAARQKRKIRDIFVDEIEEFDAERSWRFQRNQQCHAFTRTHPLPPRHQRRTLQCQGRRKETPSTERRATFSDKKRKANKSVRIPKVKDVTEGDIIRMEITLQVEDFIHGIIIIRSTLFVPVSKVTTAQSVKIARR